MFTIQSVSQLSGIPARTIRTWETRYQAISPQRTERGYRIYSEQDIQDLKWLRDQVQRKGTSIKLAVEMLHKRKQNSLPLRSDELVQPLVDLLLQLDSHASNRLLDLYFSQFDYEYVFHDIMAPALIRIGDQWEHGLVSESEEHFATNLLIHRFYQYFRIFDVNPSLPKILCFCPEGETHQIGLLLFALFLRKQGVDTIFLGAGTPYNGGLKQIMKKKDIEWLAISVTMSTVDPISQLIDAISTDFPAVKYILGGQGLLHAPETIQKWIIGETKLEWMEWFNSQFGER
ncbi:MerR family transcriptional regulator [Ammoniphilus sp. YIM 78166]|uniref:MerR family transcriptional regulator n=1 Tax=Ammoniphilus sp. YIM 78166 TaxID=1644106 RepID=UPI0010700C55|nr:MerR family transcriptional regulator [Ammoniphilus sp. YIM 78166]